MSGNDATSASSPLLTDEARAWIGRRAELPSAEVSERDIRKFVIALDERNPIYIDAEAAAAAGHPSLPAPPMFYHAATRPLVWRDEMTPDGGLPDRRVPVGEGRVMAGEYDIEFLAPVHAGDRLSGTRTLVSLTEKQGSRRRFVVAEWRTEFFNQDGRLVVRETSAQLLF